MTVKLTDFGIARAGEQTRLTQVGSVVGTAAYLAPEQARGEEATPASDVYALGVVIYQLLTGRLPHEGSSLAEMAIRRESERPLSPSSYNPGVPETLSTAVLLALQGDPTARYSSARALADGLRTGLAGRDPSRALASEAPTTWGVTESTRKLPRTDEEPTTPVVPAPAPRRPPARRPPRPAIQPTSRRGPSTGSAVRWILILLLLGIVVAVVVALVSLANNAGDNISVDEVVQQEVQDQVTRLDEFIQENTAPE
jgi:serine/threonine-protein kinase